MSETIEGTYVPVNDMPVEGSTEIVPVNNGELQEITPAQMAGGLLITGLIGYGIGKLTEKVVKLFNNWLDNKLDQRAKERAAEGKKEDKDPLETPPAKNAGDDEKSDGRIKRAAALLKNKKRK